MTPGLWDIKILEKKNLGKIDVFFENAPFWKEKIRQQLKMILNGRLSKQQLNVEIIYRKGGAKRHIILVYDNS